MNKEIKLHTIATFQDKEYELEELLNELLKENFKLQQRIDKAIEYINKTDWYLPQWEVRPNQPSNRELLEILKGDNNE